MLTWLYCTLREGVTGEVARTNAHGCVAHHTTLGIGSTRTFARIFAFIIHTRQM